MKSLSKMVENQSLKKKSDTVLLLIYPSCVIVHPVPILCVDTVHRIPNTCESIPEDDDDDDGGFPIRIAIRSDIACAVPSGSGL